MTATVMDAVLEEDDLLAMLDASLYVPKRQLTIAPTPNSLRPNRTSPAPSIAGSIRRRRRTASLRTTDSQRLPPLLLLPSELLLYILDLSLPSEQTLQTAPERNATLQSLALVHPYLTSWAQTRLYRDCLVSNDRMVERLIQVTTAATKNQVRPGELAKTITNLKIWGPLDSPNTLARLVQQLPHLDTLQLNDLDGLEMRAFVLLPRLKTFEARRTGFRSRFRLVSQARASPIESFSIINCTAHDDAFSGFTLPYLRTLILRDISLPPPSPLAVLEQSEAFSVHAYDAIKLTHLATDEHNFHLLFPLRQRRYSTSRIPTSDVRSLHLIKFSLLSPLLDLLVSNATTSPTRNFHEIPKPSLPNLETLHLSPPTSFLPGSVSFEKSENHFVSLLASFEQLPENDEGGGGRRGELHVALKGLKELILDEKYLSWLLVDNNDSSTTTQSLRTGLSSIGELITPPPRPPTFSRTNSSRGDIEQQQLQHADRSLRRLLEVCRERDIEVRVQESPIEMERGGRRSRRRITRNDSANFDLSSIGATVAGGSHRGGTGSISPSTTTTPARGRRSLSVSEWISGTSSSTSRTSNLGGGGGGGRPFAALLGGVDIRRFTSAGV